MGKIRLYLEGIELELTNDTYSESLSNVDFRKTSEAGTTLRSVTRTGIPNLSIAYKCIDTELVKLKALSKRSSLIAKVYDEATDTLKDWKCYMDSFQSDLLVEDEHHRNYSVSFKLNDLED